jgi:hypothetical protein
MVMFRDMLVKPLDKSPDDSYNYIAIRYNRYCYIL